MEADGHEDNGRDDDSKKIKRKGRGFDDKNKERQDRYGGRFDTLNKAIGQGPAKCGSMITKAFKYLLSLYIYTCVYIV